MKSIFINILNIKPKNNGILVMLIVVLTVGVMSTLVGCTPSSEEPSAPAPLATVEPARPTTAVMQVASLDEAVKLAFLNDNKDNYLSGECIGEGHIILGYEEKSDDITVYALTMYGEYGFEDGNFVKVSGSGVIPAVFTFTGSEDELVCTKIEYPEDGSGYGESIKKMFPLEYQDRVLSFADSDIKDLESQEHSYPASYLKEIGRDATIGNYGDFEHTLLTDVGVSVEVSNITCSSVYSNFPMWIGNYDKLENGIRYVYETSYDSKNHEIDFTKYEYETNTIVEIMRLDSITGLQIK